MGNCLNCKKEIQEYTGRRPKKYCSASCRQKHFQAHKKDKPPAKASTPKKTVVLEISAFDAYKGDIERAGSIEQIKAIDKDVQRDTELNSRQKETLKQMGIAASQNLDF